MKFRTCKAIEDDGCGQTKPVEDFRVYKKIGRNKATVSTLCRECENRKRRKNRISKQYDENLTKHYNYHDPMLVFLRRPIV